MNEVRIIQRSVPAKPKAGQVQLRDLLSAIWRRKLVVAVVFVLVVASGILYVSRQDDVYESTATIALLPASNEPAALATYESTVRVLIPTYGQIIRSPTFLDGVSEDLPGALRGTDISGKVSVDPSIESGVIRVNGRTDDPDDAAAIANEVAEAFAADNDGNDVVRVDIIDEARPVDTPVAPQPTLTLVAAVVLGALLAVGAALLWDRLFGRITTTEELAAATGLPVLGAIPRARVLTSGPRVVVSDIALRYLDEAVREIRSNLLFAIGARGSVAVTSLNPGEGKSLLAVNLAVSIGEFGVETLLIDADLRKPVQHQVFGIQRQRGLTSTVLTGTEAASLPVPSQYENVRVVVAGPPVRHRAEEVDVFLHQLPTLTELSDVVVVDCPPLRATADVRLLGVATSGVLLVVESGKVRARELVEAIDSLGAVGARVVGVVLTKVSERQLAKSVVYGYSPPPPTSGNGADQRPRRAARS